MQCSTIVPFSLNNLRPPTLSETHVMRFQNLSIPRKVIRLSLSSCLSHAPGLASARPFTLRHLLSSAASTLPSLLRIHALAITAGDATDPFLAAKLVSLYALGRRPDLSSHVFGSVPPSLRDAFLYNSLIKSHFSNANFSSSLDLYREMLAAGARPDHFTMPMVVSACAQLGYVMLGRCVHGAILRSCLFTAESIAVGSSLVFLYVKCGVLDDALKVFDEMPVRDVVAWTAIIVGCARNGACELGLACFKEMLRDEEDEGGRPNNRTVEGGLQACLGLDALWEGRSLHGFSLKSGIERCCSVKSLLLSLYSKCESLEESVFAFDELPEKDVVSWTAVVGVYARKGLVVDCVELYRTMEDSGVEPDEVIIGCLLTGFVNTCCVLGGKAFHGIILRKNFEFGTLVVNSLLSMYCKFELLDVVKKIIDMMGERNAETWNLIVCEYGKMKLDIVCLDMFREMQLLGFGLHSDLNTLVSVISSCSRLETSCLGKSVHCHFIKCKIFNDASVSNALISMYGRCGRLDLARKIFDQEDGDVVTWNALISAYTYVGYSYEALSLFDKMLVEDIKPDATTLLSVLSACSTMSVLQKGKWVHNYIKEMGLESDLSLCTALVDMYAKCGQLETSRAIFDSMLKRDEVSWNVMISGYGNHGYAKEALEIFREMEKAGVRPNELTFLVALSACSHAGLVEEGRNLFDSMGKYSISPTLKHYSCMVDLLGRAGHLHEAEAMVCSMPLSPDGGIWGALLGACRIHNNAEMGERVARRAFESDPEHDGYYILMSNLYGCFERWEEMESLRGMMRNQGVRKRAGWSVVELDQGINVFTVEDKSHPQYEQIDTLLGALCRQMEELSCDMESGVSLL